MALAEKPVLNQAILEVRYLHGVVFLDKCGSLTLKLERVLGEPFEAAGLPTMEFSELRSDAERMTVRFGTKALMVTQAWAPNIARLEQLTPGLWHHVAEVLNVGHTVSRCGARFWWLWKVNSLREGEECLLNSGLFGESDEWNEVFGRPHTRIWSAESPQKDGGTVRAGMMTLETKAVGGPMRSDIVDIVPQYSILLDLDYAYPGREPFSLQRAQLKEFIHSSWQQAQDTAKKVRGLLRGTPEERHDDT